MSGNRDAHLPDPRHVGQQPRHRPRWAGQGTEALAAAQEAVDLRRELAAAEPEYFTHVLSRSVAALDWVTVLGDKTP
jgi:hypothetical protein